MYNIKNESKKFSTAENQYKNTAREKQTYYISVSLLSIQLTNLQAIDLS